MKFINGLEKEKSLQIKNNNMMNTTWKTHYLVEIDETSTVILNIDTLFKHLPFCLYQASEHFCFGENILQYESS